MAIPQATTPEYDPNAPVYALPTGTTNPQSSDPNLDITSINDSSQFIDPTTSTVEGRVKGLLDSSNPLLQSALTKSDQAYNARGLLNSQGAVQAGTGAMIDQAIKIATPDAALYGSLAQQNNQTANQEKLNNQLSGIEYQKSLNNAQITGSLAKQDYEGKIELQKIASNAAIRQSEIENQWKDILQQQQLDSQEKQSVLTAGNTMGTELNSSIERLLRDPNIVNKTDAINVLLTQYHTNMQTVGTLAGLEINWS